MEGLFLELYLVIRTAVSWWDGWASSRTFWVCCHKQKLRNVVAALKLMTGPFLHTKKQQFNNYIKTFMPSPFQTCQCLCSSLNSIFIGKWRSHFIAPSCLKHILAILKTLWSKQNWIRCFSMWHPIFRIKKTTSKNDHILNLTVIKSEYLIVFNLLFKLFTTCCGFLCCHFISIMMEKVNLIPFRIKIF